MFKFFRNTKRSTLITVIAGTTVLTTASAAMAFVLLKGSGQGSSTAQSANGYSMSVTVGSVNDIVPGDSARNVAVTVQNTGNAKLQVNSVAVTVVSFTPASATVLGETCGTSPVTSGDVFDTINVTSPTDTTDVLAKDDSVAGSGPDQTVRTGTVSITDSSTVNQNCLVGATITLRAGVNGG